MNTIADYMTGDTKLPPYLPYPRFLMETDLTQTAKLLYAVLLDRANLSLANGWQDDEGQIYIVFPVYKIANAVDRSPMTVKNAFLGDSVPLAPLRFIRWAIPVESGKQRRFRRRFPPYIAQPASGRSSALPCLAAVLAYPFFHQVKHLHGLFIGPIISAYHPFD